MYIGTSLFDMSVTLLETSMDYLLELYTPHKILKCKLTYSALLYTNAWTDMHP